MKNDYFNHVYYKRQKRCTHLNHDLNQTITGKQTAFTTATATTKKIFSPSQAKTIPLQ